MPLPGDFRRPLLRKEAKHAAAKSIVWSCVRIKSEHPVGEGPSGRWQL
jgi:hypothetical protein